MTNPSPSPAFHPATPPRTVPPAVAVPRRSAGARRRRGLLGGAALALMLVLPVGLGAAAAEALDEAGEPLSSSAAMEQIDRSGRGGAALTAAGPGTPWHLQLSGRLQEKSWAVVYDIDLFDTPTTTIASLSSRGKIVHCYFSAGSYEDWRPDKSSYPASVLGKPLDGWPGERWLDFRHPSVLSVMRGRLDLAVSKGCDGVDPDNVDTFTQNSGFQLSESDQIAYNRWMANRAHERGLAVGLKNDLDQVDALVEYYDFQVNEQCHEYNECDVLQPFVDAGKPVFNVEYPGSEGDANAYAPELCPQALAADLRTVMSPLELDGTWRVACD